LIGQLGRIVKEEEGFARRKKFETAALSPAADRLFGSLSGREEAE